jgi:hypothetical protein
LTVPLLSIVPEVPYMARMVSIERMSDHQRPVSAQRVTVKITGYITEVRYCSANRGCPIEKLDRDTFIDLATGEVREFEHHESRIDDSDSLSQSLRRLRDLINCNVTDPATAKWLTLTYAENMRDSVRLYDDFKAFNARLRYWLKINNKPRFEYIAVAEPQKRGAWHLHVFLIFPSRAPFIHFSVISRAWRQGAVHVKALDNIDNFGAYLTPYLTDIPLLDGLHDNAPHGFRITEETDGNGNKTSNSYIKGGRLKLYPAGFRIYRASRGVKRPAVFECTEDEAMQLVGSAPLTYEKTIKLTDENNGSVVNVINYRQYNEAAKREGELIE